MFPLQHPVTHLRLRLSFDQVRHRCLYSIGTQCSFFPCHEFPNPIRQSAKVLFHLHTLVSLDGPIRHYMVMLVIDPTATEADRGENSYLIFTKSWEKSRFSRKIK